MTPVVLNRSPSIIVKRSTPSACSFSTTVKASRELAAMEWILGVTMQSTKGIIDYYFTLPNYSEDFEAVR